jgi:hypothetical protein
MSMSMGMSMNMSTEPEKAARPEGKKTTKTREESGNSPVLVLVKLVAHVLSEFFELALALHIVSLDEGKLEEPEAPTEVLEALALFEVLGDLCADLPCFSEGITV